MLTERNDIAIFILFLMRNLGYPLEYYELHDIITQDGFVNSFDATDGIYDLVEKGNLRHFTKDGKDMYEITEHGELIADELQSNLLSMIREKSLRSALRLMNFKKKGVKIVYDAKPNLDTTYEVTCGIVDKGEETMMIHLHVDNEATKLRILRNYKEHPERIYQGMLALLTGEMNYLFDRD